MTTKILVGHVLDKLGELPESSVHMVWTSVPYWGLRAYGTEPQVWGGELGCEHEWRNASWRNNRWGAHDDNTFGEKQKTSKGTLGFRGGIHEAYVCRNCGAWRGEHGLEPSLSLWLEHEVLIWRAVRRVLRDDGTVWLNCGDAYASTANGRPVAEIDKDNRTFRDKPINTAGGAFKPKDRIMMPARLAIALQDDGWWLRDEIIWRKPNPMPSSVKDRTTPAHEMLYMLTKAPRYFYDRTAIQEPFADDRQGRDGAAASSERNRGGRKDGFTKPNNIDPSANGGRNKRSVWNISLEPFVEAHFATAPTKLVEPCVLAGTSSKGVCPNCGAPWVRVIETETEHASESGKRGTKIQGKGYVSQVRENHDVRNGPRNRILSTFWEPSCKCRYNKGGALDLQYLPIPATVLDPFAGSGTTALVAQNLGRNAILIELNPEYAKMARRRLRKALHRVDSEIPEEEATDLPLFGGQ